MNIFDWFIYLKNLFLETVGYRKRSALDKPDSNDFRAEDFVKLSKNKMPSGTLLWDSFPQDQKNTNRCTGFSGGHLASMVITTKKSGIRTIEGNDVWLLQIKNGTADERRGDYIQSTAKALTNLIFPDNYGNKYKFKKYMKVKRKDIKKYLNDGYPILTGANTHRIMCNRNWYWKPGSNTGGHAFCLVGYDNDEGCYWAVNSWGRWGVKGSGLFKIKYGQEHRLFSPYILDEIKIIK